MEAGEQIDSEEVAVGGAPGGRLKRPREPLRAETAGN